MTTIEVARDFSRTPGQRFAQFGPHSGEAFRGLLVKALREHPSAVVTVVLDGTEGYGSSFLEEAFGGLIRHRLFSPAEIDRRLRVISKSRLFKSYEEEVRQYINEAARRL